jgi:hypothetical protein
MFYRISIIALFIFSSACGQKNNKNFMVCAGDYDLINAPVYVDIQNTGLVEKSQLCLKYKGGIAPAQIEKMADSRLRLWWIVNLKAGESMKYKLRLSDKCQPAAFTWNRISKSSIRLDRGNKPVIQYEHPVFDKENYLTTHKPYHHVFDPAGDQFITKGPGGLEPHHKGIFYGFRDITVGEKKVNVWAAFTGECTEHVEFLREIAGPVMGSHTMRILWKDKDGVVFAEEVRTVRAFDQPDGETLIDFHSVLKATGEPVKLSGDRQHAGAQFRAAQYVADNPKNTFFIRPADRSQVKPDVEIDGEAMKNMPWDAMNFKIEDREYTVAYLTHPSKPATAEMSERRYGRFGEYFPHMLTKDNPLELKYRFWVKSGAKPSAEAVDLKYRAFAEPPSVK